MITPPPTEAGFEAYCRGAAGINTTVMPVDDPGFSIALQLAMEWIPLVLNCVSPVIYTLTVYQWGVSSLVQFQQDQDGQNYFANLRAKFNEGDFVPGVISSTSDEATSTTLTVGQSLSDLGITELQLVKDPFGRLAVATLLNLGTLWGLS